ncbi:MAG: DUF6512 family protein [Faecalispora jeddahensis]
MKKIVIWEIIGAICIAAFGALLHFAYVYSGYNIWVGLFAPVNESVWEHLKLLYFPSVLAVGIEYLIWGRKIAGYIYAKAKSILLGLTWMVVFFYTYTGILGAHYLWLDIVSFLVAVAIQPFTVMHVMKGRQPVSWPRLAGSLLALAALAALFCWFTLSPPSIGIFADPQK